MSEPTTNTNGKAASNGQAVTNEQASTNGQARKTTSRKASQQDIAALIERTIRFRSSLHDLTHQASDLVKALKQHRRQSKAVETTLASLKQLKTLGV
jgi:hypothetical protein